MKHKDLLTLVERVKDMTKEDQPAVYQAIGQEVIERRLFDMIDALENYIKEDKFRWIERHTYSERLLVLLSYLKTNEDSAKAQLVNARIDFQVLLRSIALILDSVANAGTHTEKNARLRGALIIVEEKIDDLRESHLEQLEENRFIGHDYHQSLYPVQRLFEKIHDLQNEVKRLEDELTKRPKEESPAPEAQNPAEMPF